MDKPQKDEIEISIFGPGYGECILIHCGFHEWIIIDSCINPTTKNVAAFEYFDKIGVSYDSVRLIVATHWHDDHIRGLSKILKKCTLADFVISEAFCREEFLDLASLFQNQNDSGVTEFSKIWCYLLNSQKYPKRAIENRSLLEKHCENGNFQYKIISLSPSDAAIMLSNKKILNLLPTHQPTGKLPPIKKRIRTITPNFSAVVLLITINGIQILLGSDMENSDDETIGWIAVLNSNVKCNAQIFKVPHHGSYTAYNSSVWGGLLQEKPISVTTPFVRGNVTLPTKDDIDRIISNSGEAYLTGEPSAKRARTEHFIDKMMKEDVKNRRLVNPYFGHIRFRKNCFQQGKWVTTLSKNSVKIL